jgi:hypothetical protein
MRARVRFAGSAWPNQANAYDTTSLAASGKGSGPYQNCRSGHDYGVVVWWGIFDESDVEPAEQGWQACINGSCREGSQL